MNFLKDWLWREYWSTKEAILLLTGHNPLLVNGVSWEPDGGYFCSINTIERLVAPSFNNLCDGYASYSKQDLEAEIMRLNKEAKEDQEERWEILRLFAEAEGEQLTAEDFPSLNDCRDNERYDQCKKLLSEYRNSTKLVSHFVDRCKQAGHSINNERVPSLTFLHWVLEEKLIDNIPWWSYAIEQGFITLPLPPAPIIEQQASEKLNAIEERITTTEEQIAAIDSRTKKEEKFKNNRGKGKPPSPIRNLMLAGYRYERDDKGCLFTLKGLMERLTETSREDRYDAIGVSVDKYDKKIGIAHWTGPDGKKDSTRPKSLEKMFTKVKKLCENENL